MRLYFMFAFQPGDDTNRPVLWKTLENLRQRGFEIDIGYSAEILSQITTLAPNYDLYLLKSRSFFWLTMAAILHNKNARILNPYEGCLATFNKAVMTERLQAHHIPTPHSWLTGDVALLDSLVASRRLILKPYRGDRGIGIRVVSHPDELRTLALPGDLWLVQEYIEGNEEFLKVYVIGDHVFGIWKKFVPGKKAETISDSGQISKEVRSMALRCGKILNLSLYNVDIVYASNGPKVVDVNFFPSYQGVLNAASYLTKHIERYARGFSG